MTPGPDGPPAPGRTLVVVRHAKTEAAAPGQDDRARVLTRRGVAQAGAVATALVAGDHAGSVVTTALVSPATRTRATWTPVAEALQAAGTPLTESVEPVLYGADVDDLLSLLRLVHPDVARVVVVAHAPTVGDLAAVLHDGSDAPAWRVLGREGFRPACVATLQVDVPWSDLAPGTARLTAFDPPPC